MTTLDHAATHALPAMGRQAIATRAVNFVAATFQAWKNRRAVYRLGELTDAELHDIGLTRSDLSVAIDLPFGSDPTAHLGSVADARASLQNAARIEAAARQVA